jgi:hypothetical protein
MGRPRVEGLGWPIDVTGTGDSWKTRCGAWRQAWHEYFISAVTRGRCIPQESAPARFATLAEFDRRTNIDDFGSVDPGIPHRHRRRDPS